MTNCDIPRLISDAKDIWSSVNPSLHSKNVHDVYKRFVLKKLIKRSPRETLTTATLSYHKATTNEVFIVGSDVGETAVSDHYLVYCVKSFRDAAIND